jgi:hypothetical protein
MSSLRKSYLKIAALVAGLVVILTLALVVGTHAYVNHLFHSVTAFCNSVGASDTSEGIIERGKSQGLFYTRWKGKDDVWIMNKPLDAAPLFRIACAVQFKDGKVSGKEVIDAD